ncbi:hypothetical protein [Runella salmonicolor]|uniref:Lipoprotein n=1 Tax=Runella salmonicolor TaxID=2950278 RepID=A0ABT1FLT2_9BACT|nr:hypothetical protein [Runella salmonicolor]MCP1382702.1 hypothetical protein [Runella salmonicolor]
MRIFLCISLLFLFSCSIEETEPQIIEEYFFKKTIENPSLPPKTIDLIGDYNCKVNLTIYYLLSNTSDVTNFEFESNVSSLNEKDIILTFPWECIFGCKKYVNKSSQDIKLKASLNGYNLIFNNQQINFNPEIFTLYNGSGSTIPLKKNIYLTFKIKPNKDQEYTYKCTLAKKS